MVATFLVEWHQQKAKAVVGVGRRVLTAAEGALAILLVLASTQEVARGRRGALVVVGWW